MTQVSERPRTPGQFSKSQTARKPFFGGYNATNRNFDDFSDQRTSRMTTTAHNQSQRRKSSAVSLGSSRSHSQNRQHLSMKKGISIFKGAGIACQPTPISKRFAPPYATSHSLYAQSVSFQVSNQVEDSK